MLTSSAKTVSFCAVGAGRPSGPDEDDLIFLALAKGHLLVTGNIQDFPFEIRQGVPIVTPAEYIKIIGDL